MKKGKEKILKAMVKLAEAEVKDSYLYWPPRCIGYIYQPKRPKRSIEQ
ncbi:MAG: cyclic lactone autoinducer peptide [Roseburia sp.]|nr:cyclic lactone autoinducer peptide [Roseburia sp.]MCM1278418.1 cyclic lactone autoinducer peptide [Robinsoniella sp.]